MKYADEIAKLLGGKIEKVEDIDVAYRALDARGGFDAKLINKLVVNACKYIFELEKSSINEPEVPSFDFRAGSTNDPLWPDTDFKPFPKKLVKTVTKRIIPKKKHEKGRVQPDK